MMWRPEQKVDVYAWTIQGLLTLEPKLEKQLKYVDFIDIYIPLNDNERQLYQQRYPEEYGAMVGFAERFREEGMQQGMQQGIQQGMQQGIDQGVKLGEAALLRALLKKRFGALPDWVDQKLNNSTTNELELWAERILDAEHLDTLFD